PPLSRAYRPSCTLGGTGSGPFLWDWNRPRPPRASAPTLPAGPRKATGYYLSRSLNPCWSSLETTPAQPEGSTSARVRYDARTRDDIAQPYGLHDGRQNCVGGVRRSPSCQGSAAVAIIAE